MICIKDGTDMIKLLYIDLFCGAGGTSTGVENARYADEQCAKVIACVNHDANAIASHAANHPDALHFTEDIRTLELSPLVAHVERMKKIYPMHWLYYGPALNVRTSVKLRADSHGTPTVGRWLNIFSDISRILIQIIFR